MKIVAVTACPTGIAHTYMAAARLEKIAKRRGHEIKVETQGAIGIENKLTENDIRQAEIAIFAVDVQIEGLERFNGIKVIQVRLKEAINNTEPFVKRLCMMRSSAVFGTLKGVWEKGVSCSSASRHF